MSIVAIGQTSTYIQGAIDAYVVSRDPVNDQVTIRLDLYYRRTNAYTGVTGPTSLTTSFTVTSHTLTGSVSSFTLAGGQQNVWQYTGITVDQVIGAGSSGRTITVGWNTTTASQSGSWIGSGSGTISFTNAPTGISASDIVPGTESFTANVSITGWGGEGNSSTRYRELQCWTYDASSLVAPRRFQASYGDSLSGNITVDNSSSVDSGTSLNITGNTRYTLGMYASNGVYGTISKRIGDYVTLAYQDTLTLDAAHSSSLDIDYSVPADGGFYTKTLEYSIDGGTTWTAYGTISGGLATTGSFTISNLSANTQYTIQSRVTTTAGTTANVDLVAQTIGPEKPTISVVNSSSNYQIQQITYGTSTYGGGTNPATYLYGGDSANPTTVLESKTTTGDTTFDNTGLLGNKLYCYRARSVATFDGIEVWGEYSDEVSLATRLPAPVINTAAVLEYETASTVKVRLNVAVLADEGYRTSKTLYLRYSTDGGSTYTAWEAKAEIITNSATILNIDVSGLAVATNYRFAVRTLTPGYNNQSSASYIDFTTTGAHQPPTNFDYSLQDGNSSLQTWLSTFSGYTNPTYVQGQSEVQCVISDATKGTCSDGATLAKYVHTLVVDSNEVTTTSLSYPLTVTFGSQTPANRTTDYTSNLIAIQGRVYDSLDTYTQVSKSALALSWRAPTITASGERLARMGTARIDYSGTYARLQDSSLNNGNNINSIQVQYRVLDASEAVVQSWTTITPSAVAIDSDEPFLMDYSGRASISGIPTNSDCTVEVRVTDHFTSVTSSFVLAVWDNAQINESARYDIELWDWKTSTYIADLSYLVIGDLNITWELNDVEEVSFEMDLTEFEKKCQEMGLDSEDLLKPYAHDIRIRRNGEYIVGCQIVDVDIQISNNPPSRISVKGTGFLNLLKDQYILNEAWSGYTYAEVARKLVQAAQSPDCLIKNPTGDIDTSYWLARNGTISYNANAHSGDGCISCSRSGAGWLSVGSQMSVDSGENINIDVWVKGQSGITCYVRESKYVMEETTQITVASITLDGTWQHIQVDDYQTAFENGYIIFECSRTDSSTKLLVDDCYIHASNDDSILCNMNIPLGVDTASSVQENTRQVNYELQNIKDALIDLTNMEDDNFDFEFLPDRTFNVYQRKGEDKLNLEVAYPGNIDSMIISRSASNLANKVIAMGSGIGDERLQTILYNNVSRESVGTRESVTIDSNISLEETLRDKAIGNLYDRKDPTNIPRIIVKDGSINPSNLKTGDIILVEAHGEHFIESTTGEYRVMKIACTLSENAVESMTLTVEPPLERPSKKMIRYIRDSISGNSVTVNNHWVEVQALMLVGNEYVNVAQGKTVTCSFTPTGTGHTNPQIVTDGNTTASNYLAYDVTSGSPTGAVTIDLGDEYPIDYVRVWHFWNDNRLYSNNTLSVGTELVDGTTGTTPLEDVLWQYSGASYPESSRGKRSKWLQANNVIWGGEEES